MGKCKICNKAAERIVSFGKMPIANGFLNRIPSDEFFYNLSVAFCPECFMVQLDETVKPDMLFNADYQFISSTSDAMAGHFEKISAEILEKISGKSNPFVIELGCNDGIMLRHIAARGVKHLGIEPSGNVASLARNNGVKVLESFFNEPVASQIVRDYGQADVICGSNVFCHIENINSVFKGIGILLKNDGVLFFEDPYLLSIIKKSAFDQIYDEHIYYFSGLSVSKLARKHDMQLVDMHPQDVHGGSMRYYLKNSLSNTANNKVGEFLSEEKALNLDRLHGYSTFKDNVDKICSDLRNTLSDIKRKGNRIVAYGATSKSTTLLNYAKIGPEIIDYICDITPNKINKYTPGMHIPIKSHEAFVKDTVLYALLLAWNHKKEILEKEKEYRRKGGKFITYFPEVVIE